MIKYTEVIDEMSGYKCIRAELGNGVELSIPSDPANSDYQAYLASLEKPSTKKKTAAIVDEA
jgi:hypothetical protein